MDQLPLTSSDPPAGRLIDGRLALVGLLGGGLSGLLGVGGGVVMVPLLVLWCGAPQRDAHAISLGAIIVISLGGLAPYALAGAIAPGYAAALAVGAVAGARLGANLLVSLDERRLKLTFGTFLMVIAIVTVIHP